MAHQHSHQHDDKMAKHDIRIATHALSKDKLDEFFSGSNFQPSEKEFNFSTTQRALARAQVYIGKELCDKIKNKSLKGTTNILELAETSAINGAKQVSSMLSFFCPANVDHIQARAMLNEQDCSIDLYCYVSAFSDRAIETEAMSGVNTGALAVFEICKNISHDVSFGNVQLLYREHGHQGIWVRKEGIPKEVQSLFIAPEKVLNAVKTAVVSISDKAVQGMMPDVGNRLVKYLEAQGADVIEYKLLPANVEQITNYVKQLVEEKNPQLIMIRGATGVSPFDRTPVAMEAICERIIPGIGELMRTYGSKYTPEAWTSCCEAGILKNTLIITMPGAEKAIDELMQILPAPLTDAIQHMSEMSLETADQVEKVMDTIRIWP
ncbi:MAG TPA: cyclic pyranopterin monophosphate synthase MoaC [Legionella sp.]|nr:cyclic pyranopterin monophosphate synthase MoaC [Legionella sp.]